MKPVFSRLAVGSGMILLGCATPAFAIDVAGSLLIDLEADDYVNGAITWSQNSATGIAGDFTRSGNGTPTKQLVAGVPAVVFDGGAEQFAGPVTTGALHDAGATHSVEMWVFQGNARAEESVLSWSRRGGPAGTFAGFRYGTNTAYGAIARWAQPDMGFTSLPALGQWHHLVFTYDGAASKTQKIYVDGVLQTSEAVTDPASGLLDAYDSFSINLGNERENNTGFTFNTGTAIPFSGALSKVRIHSGVLDAAQVANNFEAEKAPYLTGLTAQQLLRAPIHRYSFGNAAGAAGDGSVVLDTIGGMNGVVRGAGATFTGSGVTLPGGSSATQGYIDLPNKIVSPHEAVTIEVWATQSSTQNWSRVVDVGNSTIGEVTAPGGSFNGNGYVLLSGNTGTSLNQRLERTGGSIVNGNTYRDANASTVLGSRMHQVLTFDPALKEWRWYRNGVLMEVLPENAGPTTLNDVNTWLGRSNFAGDSNFAGTFDEARIYNYTMTEGQAFGNYLAGPDSLNLAAPLTSLLWTPTAAGTYNFDNAAAQDNWGTGAGGAFPSGIDATATIVGALAGDQTVNLNTPVTLGALNLGTNSGTGRITLAAGSGGSLTMQSALTATIQQAVTSLGDTIGAPVTLASDTTVSNSAAAALTLGGSLGGSAAFTKSGSGDVVLTGDNSGYAGAFRPIGGRLVVGNGGASGTLGSGPVQFLNGADLVINRSDAVTFTQATSGAGDLFHNGSGTLTIVSGAVNHTGTVTAEVGDLVQQGTIDGVQNVRIDGNASFEGNSFTRPTGWFSLGVVNGGTAVIKDNAQLLATGGGDFNVGDVGTGQSVLRVEGGSAQFKQLYVGKNTGTSGVVLQSGGAVSKAVGGGDSRIGGAATGTAAVYGSYRIAGGTLSTDANLQIGAYGIGVMEIDGGAVSVSAGWPVVARFQDGSNESRGLLDVRSGSFTQGAAGTRLIVAEEGIGVLDVRGSGQVTAVGGLIVGGGPNATNFGDGTVNLGAGGTISTALVGQFNNANATGRFNFHGGTLKAGASSATFFEGLDQACVYSGGAAIDTNGNDVTVNQPLLAPTGDGVASIPVLNGGSGYLGAPVIEINGGGGSGATAVANLDGAGSVTGITITNPGTGYTSAPTVGILGGGAGSGLVLDTAALAANSSGGLTKTGAGTLTLGGANTYTGATVVNGGTLALGPSGSLAASVTIQVNPGATLDTSAASGWSLAAGQTLRGAGTVNTGTSAFVVAAGATLAPGSSPGTLDISNSLSFQAGSTFAAEIEPSNAPNSDLARVGGDLLVDASAKLALAVFGADTVLPDGTKFTLVDYAGTWNGTGFDGFGDNTVHTLGLNQYLLDYNDPSAGGSAFTLTVVPEPSAALLSLLGLAPLLRRRR